MIRTLIVALALAVVALPASAQPARQRGAPVQGAAMPARRRMVEQKIRQRLWEVTKRRLALSDEQMTKLEQITIRYDERRRELGQQEKTQRQALRRETLADSAANQAAIAAALEQVQQLQRQRIEMQIEEQKELAAFMTPLQRAKFLALQEEFRRRMQELLRDRPGVAARGAPLQSP